MTIELTMLAGTVVLLIVLIVVAAVAGIQAQGLGPLAGPRDELPPRGRFQARALRVVDNHREGLTIFAPLILISAVAGVHSAWTVLGAELFFFSRVAHAALYLAGVPYLRTVAFAVGVAGALMVLGALFGIG